MPTYEVENTHELPSFELTADPRKMHRVQYKNFSVECGRFVGEKVLMHFYSLVRIGPEEFRDKIREKIGSSTYPAQFVIEHDVGVGGVVPRGKPGTKSNPGVTAVSVIWLRDLPDDFLAYVRGRVQALDAELG